MYRYVGLVLLLGASGLFAEPCRVPRKRCTQVPVERISEELRKEMSRREDKRHPVSIALQDGTSVNGIVLGWSAAGIALGTPGTGTTIAPSAIRRVSMRRATNPWVRGAAGFFLGCAVGVFGILATADSDVPGGLIAFGGGMAVGVAMGRAKTVEWETR